MPVLLICATIVLDVGQVVNLRPIVNRPDDISLFRRRRIANPPQVNNLPHMLRVEDIYRY